MIDCHCHLCSQEFDTDLAEVIDRGRQSGVRACLVNSEGVYEFEKVLQLSAQYPTFCIPCFGVHPVQYEDCADGSKFGRSACKTDLEGMEEAMQKHHQKLVAIGEVGLDFTPRYIHNDTDKDDQRYVLATQIEMAKKYQLPLIAHSRSSSKPVIEVLRQNNAQNVLLHAFDGNVKSAKPAIQAGYHFSIPPCAINGDQKKSIVKEVPMDQLLLETDCPVLGPNKQERNEPSNLSISAQVIAEVKGISVDDVIKITTQNAFKLFPKLKNYIPK